jgi:hypothetical protein
MDVRKPLWEILRPVNHPFVGQLPKKFDSVKKKSAGVEGISRTGNSDGLTIVD